MVNGFELAAIDRDRSLCEQPPLAAKHDEFAAHVLNRCRVLGSKVSQRLEVRRESPDQPHQLKIATRLLLEPARGLDPVQISIQVNLEHRRRLISRSTRRLRLHAFKTELREVQ